jgi:hypothetical protein
MSSDAFGTATIAPRIPVAFARRMHHGDLTLGRDRPGGWNVTTLELLPREDERASHVLSV